MSVSLNSESTIFIRQADGKWVELYSTELPDLESGTLALQKAPKLCRFHGCETPEWFFSPRVAAFHERRLRVDPHWRMPSSCLTHRAQSRLNANTPDIAYCETTAKRIFSDKADAETHAASMSPRQYVFQCDDCSNWHLTSLNPDQQAQLESAKAQRERETATVSSPKTLVPTTHPTLEPNFTEVETCRLYKEGHTLADITARLNIDANTIYKYLNKNNVPRRMQTTRGPNKVKQPSTDVLSIGADVDYDAEEARLLRQLEEVQRKKQMMIEAKMLRVETAPHGMFIIRKEGEKATLPMAELELLIDKLMALVPQKVSLGA